MAQSLASRWAEAITEAVREGDVQTALEAARATWTAHFVTDPGSVRAALAALPGTLWEDDPWLVTALACSYWRSSIPSERASAAVYFKEARRLLADRDQSGAEQVLAVGLCEAAYARSNGRFDEALEIVDGVEAGLLASTGFVLEMRMAFEARIRLERAQLDWHAGRIDTGHAHAQQAVALERLLWDHERATAFGVAALYAMTSESHDRVEHWASRAAEVADRSAGEIPLWRTPSVAPALTALGLAAVECGELDEAAELVERLEPAAQGSEWTAYASLIATTRLLLDERADEALESIRTTRAQMHGWSGGHLLDAFASILRMGIEIVLGLPHEIGRPAVDPSFDSRHTVCAGQFEGWILLSEGRHEEAIAAVAECVRLGDGHARAPLIDVLLVDAVAHYATGDPVRGSASVDYALRLCAESGFRRGFFHLPPAHLRPMLQNASSHPQPDAVTELIAELEQRFDATVSRLPQLSERELEILAALRSGRSQREVASQLYISHNTMKTHVRNIYRKLEVSTLKDALAATTHLGLTSMPSAS